jgi:hypothetical protein
MQRALTQHLQAWLHSTPRKPLILRGARQVGKTWLVRYLAKIENKLLIELNFEKRPELASLFSSNDPKHILAAIQAFFNQQISAESSLLFLDEIQAAPEILSKLRWFAEELPELPIIAAGSLLEFILAEHTFSMPVGRVAYAHLEPLSFEEFLIANNENGLYDFLLNAPLATPIPTALHQKLLLLFKHYIFIGGMPGVLMQWVTNQNLLQVNQLQHDLLATYRDDFAKYAEKIPIKRLDEVLLSVPRMLGEKFTFSRVNKDLSSLQVKAAVELLLKARLCHKIGSCYANGIPLGAEIRVSHFKMIMLDVGLVSALLGLDLQQITTIEEINLINQGGVSEQVAGQLLRTLTPYYIEPALYYWTRDLKGSAAEIDYLIQHRAQIIPIEVKSGSTGSLKSLHLFMHLKKLPIAVRINSDMSSVTEVSIKLHDGSLVEYTLLSIPFYWIGQLPRLLNNLL